MTKMEKSAMMERVVQDWQSSGISQAAYARLHNFKANSFHYWIRRFVPPAESEPAFIQIGQALSSHIHIRYSHGVEVTLPAQTPVGLLKALIQL
jgi:hypothetical protein